MKFKLYHKTFIITFITTVLTLTVFTILLQAFTGVFLNNLANDQFNNAIKQVRQINKVEDFTVQRINEIEDEYQTSIRLYNTNNELIYPRFGGAVSLVESAQSVNLEQSNQDVRVATEMMNIEGNVVVALLTYNANMRAQELQQIFLNMIPMLLLIGLLMSLIISYLYAKSTVKKINQMNNTMSLMSTMEYDDTYVSSEGDELNDLENQIHFLYDQLLLEMEKIKNFEMDRQVFMRGTIHELKTPIMIMEMQLRELLDSTENNSEEEHQVLELQQRLIAMKELVNGGLDISKLESIKELEPVNIDDVTLEVLEYYETMLEDKQLTIEYTSISRDIMMHEKHLSTILSNLISNAIRYSPESSQITITQDEEQFRISNHFDYDIQNTEELNKPFVRGISDEDGHGLGLYVVSNTLQKYKYEYRYNLEDDIFTFEFKLDS